MPAVGLASGAQNAIRELGGVFGVAVLASVWSHYGSGSYRTGASFVDGMTLAIWIGAAIVLVGAAERPPRRCPGGSLNAESGFVRARPVVCARP